MDRLYSHRVLERDVLEPIKKIVLEDIPYIEKLINERKDASRDYTSYKRRLPAAKEALQKAQEQQVQDLAPYQEKVAKLEKKLANATELYQGRNSLTKKFMKEMLDNRCKLMEKQYVTVSPRGNEMKVGEGADAGFQREHTHTLWSLEDRDMSNGVLQAVPPRARGLHETCQGPS